MDPTLSQILTALVQAHQLVDQLRARVGELEAQAQARSQAEASPEVG
jgi:BMFP domain-containing protein YqiC